MPALHVCNKYRALVCRCPHNAIAIALVLRRINITVIDRFLRTDSTEKRFLLRIGNSVPLLEHRHSWRTVVHSITVFIENRFQTNAKQKLNVCNYSFNSYIHCPLNSVLTEILCEKRLFTSVCVQLFVTKIIII